MSVPRAPALRIEFADDGRALRITDARGTQQSIATRLDDSKAAEYRKALKRGLDQMKALVKAGQPSVGLAARALGELNHRGLSLIWQIFGDRRETIVRVFQESIPAWRTAREIPTITFTAELSRFVPFEFLPLFELAEWPVTDDLPTLEAAARRFPGFSAVMRREFPNVRVNQDLVLDSDPRLPLKCFVYRGLGEDELQFFRTADGIALDGPWPPTERLTDAECSKQLAEFLRHPEHAVNGEAREPRDQIHHFICHCEIDPDVSSDSLLRLSPTNTTRISDLQSHFALFESSLRRESRPLVFLNACGTSIVDPMGVTSFPRFFVEENGNRGFIGTETSIPDRTASEFAKAFYQGLLKGLSLGQAIHEARWDLLKTSHNPLGILYTVYADPDLRVSRPVAAAP